MNRCRWPLAVLAAGILLAGSVYPARTAAPATAGRTLSGIVWQDYCAFDCAAGSSLRAGNGVPDIAERRLSRIKVGLSRGACGERRPARTVSTGSSGGYRFTGLAAGSYCLSVNARQSRTAFHPPGAWTSPGRGGTRPLMRYTVVIPASGAAPTVNFGWFVAP